MADAGRPADACRLPRVVARGLARAAAADVGRRRTMRADVGAPRDAERGEAWRTAPLLLELRMLATAMRLPHARSVGRGERAEGEPHTDRGVLSLPVGPT